MAEPKRQRGKIRHTIAEHLIPEQGTYGDVWLARDTNSIWFTARNGVVFCLSDVLDGVVAHTPPRHGRDGEPGAKGDKGDSIIGPAGKDGQSIIGPQGPKGDRGDMLIPNESEITASVLQLRADKAHFLAAVQLAFERNTGRKHRGLQAAVANTLQTLKTDAGL